MTVEMMLKVFVTKTVRAEMRIQHRGFTCVLLYLASDVSLLICGAFTPSRSSGRKSQTTLLSAKNGKVLVKNARRSLLIACTTGLYTAVIFPISSDGDSNLIGVANAFGDNKNDALFKPNPLTSNFLEQLRIWEQAEADNLKYGGELAPGDAGNKGQTGAYPKLLVPILQIANELNQVNAAVQDRNLYPEAVRILKQTKYEKIEFKKIFNAFADNIYYSDPDRANLYLGGGGESKEDGDDLAGGLFLTLLLSFGSDIECSAMPKSTQSFAFLLRNEVLTNVEDLQAELEYVLTKNGDGESENNVKSYAANANAAIQQYLLEIVPPYELKQADELLKQS
jgi:hypothetical protein